MDKLAFLPSTMNHILEENGNGGMDYRKMFKMPGGISSLAKLGLNRGARGRDDPSRSSEKLASKELYPDGKRQYVFFLSERKKMHQVAEVRRGFWACDGSQLAFRWHFEGPVTGDPSTVAWAATWNGGAMTLSFRLGEKFYDLPHAERHEGEWRLFQDSIRVISVDASKRILTLETTIELDGVHVSHEVTELPVSKFMQDYDPYADIVQKQMNKWHLDCFDAKEREEPMPPFIGQYALPFSPFCMSTVIKIKRQWRKLHLLCQHKKFAPGGVGHKRAREEFEGLQKS